MTDDQPTTAPASRPWHDIAARLVALTALAVVAFVLVTAWGAVWHAHPLYPIALAVTVVFAGLTVWRTFRSVKERALWRIIMRVVVLAVAIAWVAVLAWLRPMGADEPALTAMASDSAVTVDEGATAITMTPTGEAAATGVFFQPGAFVDARAYAAVLRPLAEAGHTVVIQKQPAGIAFLSLGAFDLAVRNHEQIDQWVLGGHSLGGVVASIEADSDDTSIDGEAPAAAGLFLYGSYPAGDQSDTLAVPVLSLSGSEDGLTTPADIETSRANLPADAAFVEIEGATHAYFGDYGTQQRDGTPAISHDDARAEISALTLEFVQSVSP